jgi:hypothetical protein
MNRGERAILRREGHHDEAFTVVKYLAGVHRHPAGYLLERPCKFGRLVVFALEAEVHRPATRQPVPTGPVGPTNQATPAKETSP